MFSMEGLRNGRFISMFYVKSGKGENPITIRNATWFVA